jgi:DNA-binding CsgD family transcriptional regulator
MTLAEVLAAVAVTLAVLSLIVQIVARDVAAWAPRLARHIARQAARCLPPDYRDEYAEAWEAELDQVPQTPLTQVGFAVKHYACAVISLRRELPPLELRSQPDGREAEGLLAADLAEMLRPWHNVDLSHLSETETEILLLLSWGLRVKEIADVLQMTPATVHTHVRNSIAKSDVDTRTELVAAVAEERVLRDVRAAASGTPVPRRTVSRPPD